MRAGPSASAIVCSTARFNETNLFSATRSLRATLEATNCGIRASDTGPNAKQQMNATQMRRRTFPFETHTSRRTRLAKLAQIETGMAASVPAAIANGEYARSIASVRGKIEKPLNKPTNEPTIDMAAIRSQFRLDKRVPKILTPATIVNGVHKKGRSRFGSMITGHQHNAVPMRVATIKSLSLDMKPLNWKLSKFIEVAPQ